MPKRVAPLIVIKDWLCLMVKYVLVSERKRKRNGVYQACFFSLKDRKLKSKYGNTAISLSPRLRKVITTKRLDYEDLLFSAIVSRQEILMWFVYLASSKICIFSKLFLEHVEFTNLTLIRVCFFFTWHFPIGVLSMQIKNSE